MKNLERGDAVKFFADANASPVNAIVTFTHPNQTVNILFCGEKSWLDRVAIRVLPEPEEMNSGEPFVCPSDYVVTSRRADVNRAISEHNARNIIAGQHGHRLEAKIEDAARAVDSLAAGRAIQFQYDIPERRARPTSEIRKTIDQKSKELSEAIDELCRVTNK